MHAEKMSMARSLEVYLLYLPQIVEYVDPLNASLKDRNTTRKGIYRRVYKRSLPPEIIKRPKASFAAVDDWFRNSPSMQWTRSHSINAHPFMATYNHKLWHAF
jgi:asparagine synthetase B (glutamine-hydrolysing)